MASKLDEALQIFRSYEDKIFSGNYEQFTIDFIQNTEVDLNDYIEEEKNERRIKDIIGSLHYQTSCILEIIKEGNDKELFTELNQKLDKINT